MEILVTGILATLLCIGTAVIFVICTKESDCTTYKETMKDRKELFFERK